ncbi:MAG: glycosyltransferase 87 family protein [Bryobacteraceae bacterium]
MILALFGSAFTVASCWGAGSLAAPREQSGALRFVVGAAVLSLAVFLLAAMHLANVWAFAVLGAVALAGAFWLVRNSRPRVSSSASWTLWILAPFFAWYLIYALAPEASPDGSGYHLGLVRRYFEHGQLLRITTSMYASLTQGLEMLFLMAYSFGRNAVDGGSAAAVVHLAFLAALAKLLTDFDPRVGWAAAAIVVASPVVAIDAASAYNDVALACVLFALFVLLEREDANPWLVGLLAGFAFGIKYTGIVALPYALARCRKPAVLAGALLTIAPWMVKNWVFVANPVAPFFNRVFPNDFMRASTEDRYRAAMRDLGGGIGWDTPLEVTVRGGKLQGILGPAFLLTPVALLAVRQPEGRRLLLAGTIFALPWFVNLGTRFLIPAVPFFALALVSALGSLTNSRVVLAGLAAVQMVAAAPAAVDRYAAPYVWHMAEVPWRAALRLEPPDAYLRKRLGETYQIARMIDATVPAGCRVYTAWPLPDAYTGREILLDYTAALNNRLSDALATGRPESAAEFRNAGVTWLLLHREEKAAAEFAAHSEAWGAQLVAESGAGRLYRMEGKCFGSD